MSDPPVKPKTTSESDDFSDNLLDESNAVFETADFVKTATSSSHHDSEYDTASDTATSEEGDDLQDDDEDEFEDEEGADENVNGSENGENESVVLDLERQRGDGEEQDTEKKKVDDDEDRSNPQYIPKRGIFYEHDDRTAEDPNEESQQKKDGVDDVKPEATEKPTKKISKKSSAVSDRWSHDRYDESEQAPKSRAELVNSYGYDIRNEDGPPRARRRRRYGRGPSKYTRKWEDETAYTKIGVQQQQTRSPRPEDFPELNSKSSKYNSIKEEKENKHEDSGSNARYLNRSPMRKDHELNRSQNQKGSNDDRKRGDRFDGNRSQSHSDRFEENRSDKFDDSQTYNERYRQRNDGGRSHNDRYDSNRNNFDKYDDNKHQMGDKGWDRKNTRSNSGFRVGKNTIEFINQNRNKSSESSNSNNPSTNNRNYNPNNPFRTQHDYNDKSGLESISFTNTKLSENSNLEYGQSNKNFKEEISQERSITGRQQVPLRIQNSSGNPTNIQLQSSSKNQQMVMHMPQQQQIHQQQQQQQQQQSSTQQNSQAQSANMLSSDASRSTKRYSTLRQRTNVEPTQQQNSGNISLHDQQQLMLQDATLLMQLQQGKESIQLQPNLGIQGSQTFSTQPIPLQIQNDMIGQMGKSPVPSQSQSNQQVLLTPQATSQSAGATPQYQPAYYSPTEYTGPAVPPTQPIAPIPPSPSNSQLIPGQQYQTQFNGPATSYLQPPPPATFIPQPNNQQQLLNYVPSIPAAQPPPAQFQPVHQPVQSFPPYQNVPNFNTVSSGITYYAPQTQPPPRPILSQRRPTNAIPILAPPERGGSKNGRSRTNNPQFEDFEPEESKPSSAVNAPIGSPENIDHILDNMFVQRPPYQPPTRKSSSPSPETSKPQIEQPAEVIQPNTIVTAAVSSAPTPSFESGNNAGQLEYEDVGIAVSKLSIGETISNPAVSGNSNVTTMATVTAPGGGGGGGGGVGGGGSGGNGSDQSHFLIHKNEIPEQIS